jgi:pyridoxine 4-dehydrogenase
MNRNTRKSVRNLGIARGNPAVVSVMSTSTATPNAAASGTFSIGGDVPVRRLGYGTMQLTGFGVWGEPDDRASAIAVIRRAVELGVTLIDTADVYGPFVTDSLIREALHPYADDVVIATKVGFTRQGPNQWIPVGRPEYLRQQTELGLRNLGVDTIDLLQLHRIDPKVPLDDQIGELAKLQSEGKVRHIGLSEVSVDDVVAARAIAEIVSVQNLFNLSDRSSQAVLDYATAENIAFIPWFPLATGKLAGAGSKLAAIATEQGRTPSQVALAWLLHRSPVILPIPGTSSVGHLEENIAAADVVLSDEEYAALDAL